MISSAVFYFLLFTISSLLVGFTSKISNKLFYDKAFKIVMLIISLFLPSYFAGIRFGIGTDYFNYVSIFEKLTSNMHTDTEFGYAFLNTFVGNLGGNEHTLFFIVSFITHLFIFLFLYHYRKHLNVGLGFFIYLLLYYNFSFNAIRQSLSMAIILYSYTFLEEKNLYKFLITSLLAISFHNSAIVIIPFYFVYNYFAKSSGFKRSLVYLLVIVLMINYEPIIHFFSVNILNTGRYLFYLDGADGSVGFGLLLIYLPLLLPGIIYNKKMINSNVSFQFFYFMFFTGFLLKFIGYFGGAFLTRIADIFLISLVWIVPYYYSILKKEMDSFLLASLVIFWVIAFWYYQSIYLEFNGTVPYNTIF
ncbi:EpsG family protein [Aerococcus urinaeequi]|uniref:EpsG family protein n=1 Tax=Aerococcus urinaeequi TaxID=51665 RepID=A0A7M1KR91_9LACT|nr:EpsG family protein [Aerococcus urinaeequi]QOQ78664.1 EpsG family protein [Aerococcus urinaeequi]